MALKILPVILICCICQLPVNAVQNSELLTRYARNIINFNREHPQEKVYIHMDNRSYYIGDTIWFKAYVMNATTLSPTHTSGVLYVELLNDFGGEIAHRKLQIKGGMCHGEFPLDSTYRTGFYEIRAYTRNMLNMEDDATWSEIWSESENYYARNDNEEIFTPSMIAYPDAIELQKDAPETNRGKVSIRASQRISYPKAYNQAIVHTPPKVHGIDRRKRALELRNKRWKIRDRGVPLINEYIFSRVFPVFKQPDSAGQYKQVMEIYPPHPALTVNDTPAKPRPMVSFYPEGGVLIQGVESQVALEVRMKEFRESERYGYRTSAKGVVKDNYGTVVDTFETDKRGRAVITLLPKKGRSYTAIVDFADGGKARRFPIKPIEPQGYAIALTPPVGMSDLAFTIQASPHNSRRKHNTIGWTLQCRGAVTAYDTVTVLPGENVELSVPHAQLRGGVNQLSVYNADGLVVADRLFWVNPSESPATVSIAGMPDSIRPFERIALDLQVGDTLLPGRNSTFSISVTDASDRFGSYDTRNLWSDMLLSSDLKGFIDDVDSYFAHDTEEAMAADIDRLMLVQGWRCRRYEWHTMAGSVPYKQKYTPEKSLVIDGYVIKDQSIYENRTLILGDANAYERIPNLQVDASIRTNHFTLHRTAHSDSFANFSIPLDTVFYGEVPLILVLTDTIFPNSERIEKTFIPLYRAFSPPPSSYSYYQANFTDFLDVSGVDHTHRIVRKDILHNGIYILRPELIIDYTKEWNSVIDMGVPRRNYKLPDDIRDAKSYHMEYYMNIPQLQYHLYRLSNTVDIVFRNNPILDKYNAPGVKSYGMRYAMPEKIYLYGNRYRRHNDFGEVASSALPFNYAIIKYAKESPRHPPFLPGNGVRETYFEGYSVSHEFYSPDYSTMPLPSTPDYRRTLYWNPNVQTDERGRANIEFYNNAHTTHLHIQAEGITQDGGFVVYDSEKEEKK